MQPPQPVATCVTMMGVVAVGAYAQVEKLGTLYQVVVQPAILKEQRSATF